MKVLFVCLGNICRSPTAEGIMRQIAPDWQIDSAGTGGWHQGEPPDARAQAEARKRGIDLSRQRARQVQASDYRDFDRIVAMDSQNLRALRAMAPTDATARIGLLLDHLPDQPVRDVPDPYYEDGFDRVFTLIERACRALREADQPQARAARAPNSL